MLKPNIIPFKGSAIWRPALIGCLVALLGLILPATVLAAPPTPTGAETCVECHQAETDAWQNSPHARAAGNESETPGATCEACHGSYIKDHPEAGVMQLTVDSSICEDCHTTTFRQWENSTHAQAEVQCIGCHLSHSQEFRLTDEALCGSCHRERREDYAHTAHDNADVGCTDCHLSTTSTYELALVSAGESSHPIQAPSHDFTGVSAEDCVSCHGQDIHNLPPGAGQITDAQILAMADRVPALAAKLETTEEENRSLQLMAPLCLGLGLGIGGMLGIIFMLVAGYIIQRRPNK